MTKAITPTYTIPDDSPTGLAQYVQDLRVFGIGPVTARKLVDEFGLMLFDTALGNWQALMKVKGMTDIKAMTLAEKVHERFGPQIKKRERERNISQMAATVFFAEHEIRGRMLQKILSKYGEDAVAKIQANPYRLADDIDGFGFLTADAIAQKMGITGSDPRRVEAAVLYTLQQQTDKGHCFVEHQSLITTAAAMLKADTQTVTEQTGRLIAEERVVADTDSLGVTAIYLPEYYRAEVSVAASLRRLQSDYGTPSQMTEWGQKMHEEQDERDPFWRVRKTVQMVKYTDQQQQAIDMVLTHRVMILTGGPGTGKTTTLKGMLQALRQAGMFYTMCAPTGRAAQRMKEQTGERAQTIHRLLEYHPEEGFRRDRSNPLHCDAVVVDESSMIDLLLMKRLLDAIPYGGRLILVGDSDQLPSVGAGRVLNDLIDSGAIPTLRLDKIHRQADGSLIIKNAHRIIHGQMPEIDNMAGSDFFLRYVNSDEEAAEVVEGLVSERLPKAYPGMEIQVLTPRRSDIATSSDMLNVRLQDAVNKETHLMKWGKTGKGDNEIEREFRVNDRVMQMKNDYDLDVLNGDVGKICAVVPDANSVTVMYDKRRVIYEGSQLKNLSLSYATTVHKSQGSEYDIAVVVMTNSCGRLMLQRNLLYTAITRASKVCVVVAQKQALRHAIENWSQEVRNTRLKERL